MNEPKICRKAINQYGAEHQKRKAVEELAELILAISREQDERSTEAEVITEIADVSVMVEQLAMIYGVEAVKTERYRKLRRLEARLRRTERNAGCSQLVVK